MWRSQAEAEGLTLLKADNKTGYFGVYLDPARQAQALPGAGEPRWQDGEPGHLRHRRGGGAVRRAVAGGAGGGEAGCSGAPLTSEEARQQARAEGLTLLKADNKAGYFGVNLDKPGQPKPYQAQVRRGGKTVHLGSFATAEEAALCASHGRTNSITCT